MTSGKSSGTNLGESVAVAASSAVALGFLDVTRTIYVQPEGFASWWMVVAAASTTMLFGAVFLAIAWLAVVLPARQIAKFTPIALELATASFFFALVFLVPAADLPHLRSWPESIPALVRPILLALFLAFGVYFVVAAVSESPSHRHAPLKAALALPFIVAELCALLWLGKFRFGPAPGLATVALNLVALALLVATALVFRRPRLYWVFTGLFALSLSSAAGAALGLWPSRAPAEAGAPPAGATHAVRHVILVTIDTLRSDVLSCYGSRTTRTPRMDELAADGVRFAEARAPAPWTVPSIASLLTGLSPAAHTATRPNTMLPDAARTLPEVLRDSGYLTAAFGSNDLLGPMRNVSQGFAHYDFFPKPPLPPSHGVEILRRTFRDRFARQATTTRLTKIASEWLRTHAESDFFLWVHWFDPHAPYRPPARFRPAGDPPPRIGFELTEPFRIVNGVLVPTLNEREWIRRLYEGEVHYVDENVGELIGVLKTLGLYQDALIVLTSDHGEEFWDHGGFGHGHSLYREVVHVPLIVKLPGARVRTTVARPVSLTGLVPTVLEVARIHYDPAKFSERSLAALWEGDGSRASDDPLISEGRAPFNERFAVELGGRKYIREPTGREELYDLVRDPLETQPLTEISPAERDRMGTLLMAYEGRARELREHYQITRDAKFDRAIVEQLRALGYVE